MMKTQLKESKSWERKHYEDRAAQSQLQADFQEVDRKLSFANLKQTSPEISWDEFQQTEPAIEMLKEKHIASREAQIWTRRAEIFSNDDGPTSPSGLISWWQHFLTSRLGLNMHGAAGRRNNTVQSNLRTECVEIYNAAHPNPKVSGWWCPVSQTYHNPLAMIAAHVYPVKFGKETFEALFGTDVKDELMSPRNCFLLVGQLEDLFNEHRLALVPDVKDLSDEQEMSTWYASWPQEYKICLFDLPKIRKIEELVPGRNISYEELDGQKVKWMSNTRPRKRFLWYHYATCILKELSGTPNAEVYADQQYGKHYWGSRGSWFKSTGYLIGAAKILGHEYEALLNANAVDTPIEERQEDLDLVHCMNQDAMHGKARKTQDEEDDEDEDDDEEKVQEQIRTQFTIDEGK